MAKYGAKLPRSILMRTEQEGYIYIGRTNRKRKAGSIDAKLHGELERGAHLHTHSEKRMPLLILSQEGGAHLHTRPMHRIGGGSPAHPATAQERGGGGSPAHPATAQERGGAHQHTRPLRLTQESGKLVEHGGDVGGGEHHLQLHLEGGGEVVVRCGERCGGLCMRGSG